MKKIEETLIITSPNKKKIYTTIGYPKRKSKTLVLFVHGLASTELWPTMLLGSWYFRKLGYAYCRINLYDWRPGARSLMTSDLLQHSLDVDTVAAVLQKKGFSKILAVGHSFGGLTLLQSNTAAFKAISLWDISSFISHPPKKRFKTVRSSGAIYLPGACELLMSDKFRQGMVNFPNELELISKIKIPTQICYAAGKNAVLIESSKRYFKNLQTKKELVAIPNASHSFTEEGKSEQLFKKTDRWFRRFID